MQTMTTDGGAVGDGLLEPFVSVEFELALDLQDPSHSTFEDCVRNAAMVVGGEILFDMPSDGSVDDAARMAAVRIPNETRDRILFAVLNEAGTSIRLATREEVGDRFHGFARAFVGVLERIRDDIPLPMRIQGAA